MKFRRLKRIRMIGLGMMFQKLYPLVFSVDINLILFGGFWLLDITLPKTCLANGIIHQLALQT